MAGRMGGGGEGGSGEREAWSSPIILLWQQNNAGCCSPPLSAVSRTFVISTSTKRSISLKLTRLQIHNK